MSIDVRERARNRQEQRRLETPVDPSVCETSRLTASKALSLAAREACGPPAPWEMMGESKRGDSGRFFAGFLLQETKQTKPTPRFAALFFLLLLLLLSNSGKGILLFPTCVR